MIPPKETIDFIKEKQEKFIHTKKVFIYSIGEEKNEAE